MNKKQNSKDTTSRQLIKKQLQARLNQKFEIHGVFITRKDLECMGYDTADVDDATMEELASRIGDNIDWMVGVVPEIAEEFNIPERPANPQDEERMTKRFEVVSFSRQELEHLGYDTSNADDETMQRFVERLCHYIENDWRESFGLALEEAGIPQKPTA